jgi:hypothetical protein
MQSYFAEAIQVSVVFLKFWCRHLKWSGRDQQKQISMHTDGFGSYTFSSLHKYGHDGKQSTTVHSNLIFEKLTCYQLPAYTDVPKCFLCSASWATLLSIALSLNRKGFQSTLIQPPWFDQLVITLVSSLAFLFLHNDFPILSIQMRCLPIERSSVTHESRYWAGS